MSARVCTRVKQDLYMQLSGLMHEHPRLLEAAKRAIHGNEDNPTIRALEAAMAIHLDNLLDMYAEQIYLESRAKITVEDAIEYAILGSGIPDEKFDVVAARINLMLAEEAEND